MVYLPVVALVAACVHIFFDARLRSAEKVIETILLYELVIATGVGGVFGFLGHSMKAPEIAKMIGWQAGSPFQFEIAIANLSYGVLGILCLWFRGGFWTATIVGTTVFGWGAAYGHINDILVNHNFAPGNAGWPLYMDIIMPLFVLGLLITLKVLTTEKRKK